MRGFMPVLFETDQLEHLHPYKQAHVCVIHVTFFFFSAGAQAQKLELLESVTFYLKAMLAEGGLGKAARLTSQLRVAEQVKRLTHVWA